VTNTNPRRVETRDLRRKSLPRRGLRAMEAAIYIGVSVDKFDALVRQQRMPKPKRIDGTNVWDIDQLDVFFEALPEQHETSTGSTAPDRAGNG
jgi:predicted DNA-binding transcriptional regulator AlpA